MTERQLKYRSGIFLICLHLVVLLSIVVLRFMNGFTTDEFTTALGIIMPMFSGYTTAIVAFIAKDRHVKTDISAKVTNAYAALLFLLPTFVVAIICLAIWLQAFKRVFDNFEDFKRFVIIVESAFAAYVSIVVYAMFDRKGGQPRFGPRAAGRLREENPR